MFLLQLILFLIFLILSGFHFYWLFGGSFGTDSVYPTKPGEESTINIPKFATLIVAIGLLSIAIYYLSQTGLINLPLPVWLLKFTGWFVSAIFTLRAIGEFNYVGLFKKVKGTKFASADSKLFSPLCLFIGIIGFIIQLFS